MLALLAAGLVVLCQTGVTNGGAVLCLPPTTGSYNAFIPAAHGETRRRHPPPRRQHAPRGRQVSAGDEVQHTKALPPLQNDCLLDSRGRIIFCGPGD